MYCFTYLQTHAEVFFSFPYPAGHGLLIQMLHLYDVNCDPAAFSLIKLMITENFSLGDGYAMKFFPLHLVSAAIIYHNDINSLQKEVVNH